ASGEILALEELGPQRLQHEQLAELLVLHLVHGSHAPRADQPPDTVARPRDHLPDAELCFGLARHSRPLPSTRVAREPRAPPRRERARPSPYLERARLPAAGAAGRARCAGGAGSLGGSCGRCAQGVAREMAARSDFGEATPTPCSLGSSTIPVRAPT